MRREPVRILVPLESGETARDPARLLASLFDPPVVRVRAIHVASVAVPLFYFPGGDEMLGSLRREQVAWEGEARKALDRQVEPFEAAGFTVETEVTAGSPVAELRRRAELWRSDLIVARPRRGRSKAGRLGSVAAGLLQTAPAPVLLYRSVPAGYRIRTVLAPTDFSPFSRRALEWAILVSSLSGAGLRLLHVLPGASSRWSARLRRSAIEMVAEDRRRAERQRRRFGRGAGTVEGVVAEGRDAAEGVLAAQQDGIDLIVLGASGRTGLASVIGGVTRKVARATPCPVLVVPTTNRVSARELRVKSLGGSQP